MNLRRITALFSTGILLSLTGIGCTGFPTVEEVQVSEAPSEVQHLTVRTEVTVEEIEDPHADFHEEHQQYHGEQPQTQHNEAEIAARSWAQEIESQLADAGIRVVGERGPQPDIDLKVHVEPSIPSGGHATMEAANNLRWQVTMIHAGEAVDGSVWTAPFHVSSEGYERRRDAEQAHHESLAARVVNSLIDSTAVTRIAQEQSPRPVEEVDAVASADDEASSPATTGSDHLVASPQPNAYGLVIGIEDYRDLTPTPGARGDAERFAHMLETTLGVPDQNIHLMTDNNATRGDVLSKLLWLQKNIPSDGRIYFFFSGHGTPHVESGDSYLLPYEGRPETLEQTGLLMDDVLTSLEETDARDVLAFVDACFSGSGDRSSLPEGTRPLVPVQETAPAPRVALFSSSGATEISGNAPDADEGLFTRHIINAIASGRADINGDGQISLSELENYVTPRVAREARQLNREQTPTLNVADQLGDPSDLILVWGLPRE